MNIETDLDIIAKKSITDVVENERFVNHLKQLNADEIDDAVFELDLKISPQIDCTQCGNCCKKL